jgi:hypothetical protein
MLLVTTSTTGEAYQRKNTPLRPSREGNRTFPCFFPLVNTYDDNTNNGAALGFGILLSAFNAR